MVRNPNISSPSYTPGVSPSNPYQLRLFVDDELRKVAAALALLSDGHIDKTYSPPSKPRDGDIRYADGASWDPGGGSGIYFYNGSSWVKL